MSSYAVAISQRNFERMICGQCGIEFYVPAHFYQERYEDGGNWHCPNGHTRVFKERESDRLKRELEAVNKRLEIATNDAQRETQLRQKLEKRVRNGVCPHCKRSFSNVKRHMQTKHAEKKAS